MFKHGIKKHLNEKGVSLIELVMAVAMFSVVVLTASGIFINSLKAQKTIIAKQKVADDLRYSADFMLKELRMAQLNSANMTLTFRNAEGAQLININSPSASLWFTNSNGNDIVYSLSGNKIFRNDLSGTDGAQPISADEIEITGLSFRLNNWDMNKGAPNAASPLITVVIKARANNGVGQEIIFQTSVSPRIY